ncbi:MAG: hypothetical protein Gaeavirus37_2 [Gaeavirus sp.]|uniref:Phosphoglycerate mutase family protein n=1 Tax=Gaeavirus sp. TaxID=2487767 RepID=A0A3G5A3E4_9VIRU|nr:MAG: hypothetical protein Gaeavirus37_2 [Gaeavirus sp.]
MEEQPKYVIIIRHGPTHPDETINYASFMEFITKMILYIKNFITANNLTNITPQFISSPYKRCTDTAKLITSYLDVLKESDKPKSLKIVNYIKRWEKNTETRQESIIRATNYGNYAYKKISSINKPQIFIYITHSSIIPAFISGLIDHKLKKEKLHTACLSVVNINTRKLEKYNKSF